LVFVSRFEKKGENMKLLRNLGGALSLALLVGLMVSSVPLGAQPLTVTAFSAERTISLTNILTTVTPTGLSPAALAALAAGAIEIREQTSFNAATSTLTSIVFVVPTGAPNPTNLAGLPFSSFVATTTLAVDKSYVTTNPSPAVAFVGTISSSTATPYGNYLGASGTYSFGYTADKKINNVIETVGGLIVLFSPSATGTFTIVGGSTGGGGGTGGVTVVINGSSSATPTFTTVLNQIVLDASASKTTTGGTLTYAWAVAQGSPSASTIGGSTSTATIQLGAGKGTYVFTLTITDSKGTAPTVVTVTVNFI